ncbi:MAG: MFS transporter [Dehalococcoidia bacterium]|nr:MFS transporter [Dehalococcoidia bacterium]
MRIFYGWWVLAASVVITAFGTGPLFYGFGIFFPSIQQEFGWSRTLIGGAYSAATISGGLVTIVVGFLIEKLGPRKLMLVGISAAAVGYMALSLVQSLWMFYAVYIVLIAVGIYGGVQSPTEVVTAYWFVRRRAMAQGMLSSAIAVGGMTISPLLAMAILAYGWRNAALAVGVVIAVCCIPAALLVRDRPQQMGLSPDGVPAPGDGQAAATPASVRATDMTVRQALRTPQFWLLSVALALKFIGSGAVFVHLIPYLVDRGFDRQTAANLLGLLALVSIFGRVLFGYLGDRVSKRILLTVTMCLECLGVILLMGATTLSQVILAVVVFAQGMGTLPLIPAIRAEYFGLGKFAALSGIMWGISTMGLVAGPVVAGLSFDITGSYTSAFALFIGAYVVAILISALTPPPRRVAALVGR